MKTKKGTVGIAIISVFLALFAALEVFLCVWFFGADYTAFDALVREELPIPGLKDGISPQGLCDLPENADGYRFAMSGYLSKQPSRIYLIGENGAKYVTVSDGGQEVSTHFGGVACAKGNLYVASGKKVLQISLKDALAAENGTAVVSTGSLSADVRSVAYCAYFKGTLFVGEFYRPGNYETAKSHHLTKNGETNYAIVYCYRETEDGFESAPYAAVSVREQVQGFAVFEDGIALSVSYGLPDSEIYIYENVLQKEPEDSFEGLPLYRLDKTVLKKQIATPCMSEEIFEKDGRLYILYESLSNKYKNFVRRQISEILSVSIADLLR